MKVIIAGSRSVTDPLEVEKAIMFSGLDITEVVSGACPHGVDRLGELWAERNWVPVKRFPGQWKVLKKSAGVIRNQAMADYADALIAIWDGDSPGTRDMISRAGAKGLPVMIWRVVKEVKVVPCAHG